MNTDVFIVDGPAFAGGCLAESYQTFVFIPLDHPRRRFNFVAHAAAVERHALRAPPYRNKKIKGRFEFCSLQFAILAAADTVLKVLTGEAVLMGLHFTGLVAFADMEAASAQEDDELPF